MTEVRLTNVIHQAETQLAAAGIDNPGLDARILIAHALQIDRAHLLSRSDRMLTEEEQGHISALIERRTRREPVSRILGAREFWSLSFGINEATLVPRPDSETLIEAALNLLTGRDQSLRILDLGTGSGCLLLALLHELPNAAGLGIDCAPRAVEQARENAEQLGLADRATFNVDNWADHIEERFDVIISNPPYIAQAEIETLMPEVRDHDPHIALDGGADGLKTYCRLIPQLPVLLSPNGFAVFEIGAGQAENVALLFEITGFKNIHIYKDLNGVERCITAAFTAGRA